MKKLTLIINCLLLLFLLVSCKKADVSASDIPSDIELVRPQLDRTYYEYLKQVEDQATSIVRAVAKETLSQEVDTIYDYVIQKDYGYAKREIEVTKVYKDDVNVGDKLVLLQEYYMDKIRW